MGAKAKKFKLGKPLPLNKFHEKVPNLLLVYIFSFLGPSDLERAGSVCSSWKIILKDEIIWKLAFERLFGKQILKKLSDSWKLEYLVRTEMIRKLEFSRFYVGVVDSRTPLIDTISFADNIDSRKHIDSLAVGNIESGVCTFVEIDTGRFNKFVSFESTNRQTTCLTLSRSAALLGFFTGQVAISFYNTTDIVFFPTHRSHTMPISALSIFSQQKDSYLVASGSQDGHICVWEGTVPKLNFSLIGFNLAVAKLLINQDYVIGLDINRTFCVWKLDGQSFLELEPTYSEQLPPLIVGMELLSDGNSVLVVLESEPSRIFYFDTLSWSEFSHQTPVSCFYYNSNLDSYFALGCSSNLLIFNTSKSEPIKFMYPNNSLKEITSLRSVYFDELKALGYYENNVFRLWDVVSCRIIRKIHLLNYIPRNFMNRQPGLNVVNLIAVNKSRLIATISGKAIILGFGVASAHLAEKPKRQKKVSTKYQEKSKTILRDFVQELEEEKNLNEKAYQKLVRLQGLTDLSEEETIQLALSISQNPTVNNFEASSLKVNDSIDQATIQLDNLGLSEEEAFQLALLLSKE